MIGFMIGTFVIAYLVSMGSCSMGHDWESEGSYSTMASACESYKCRRCGKTHFVKDSYI